MNAFLIVSLALWPLPAFTRRTPLSYPRCIFGSPANHTGSRRHEEDNFYHIHNHGAHHGQHQDQHHGLLRAPSFIHKGLEFERFTTVAQRDQHHAIGHGGYWHRLELATKFGAAFAMVLICWCGNLHANNDSGKNLPSVPKIQGGSPKIPSRSLRLRSATVEESEVLQRQAKHTLQQKSDTLVFAALFAFKGLSCGALAAVAVYAVYKLLLDGPKREGPLLGLYFIGATFLGAAVKLSLWAWHAFQDCRESWYNATQVHIVLRAEESRSEFKALRNYLEKCGLVNAHMRLRILQDADNSEQVHFQYYPWSESFVQHGCIHGDSGDPSDIEFRNFCPGHLCCSGHGHFSIQFERLSTGVVGGKANGYSKGEVLTFSVENQHLPAIQNLILRAYEETHRRADGQAKIRVFNAAISDRNPGMLKWEFVHQVNALAEEHTGRLTYVPPPFFAEIENKYHQIVTGYNESLTVLLTGASRSGKSAAVNALAHRLDLPIYNLNLKGSFLADGGIDKLFSRKAIQHRPVLVHIEEFATVFKETVVHRLDAAGELDKKFEGMQTSKSIHCSDFLKLFDQAGTTSPKHILFVLTCIALPEPFEQIPEFKPLLNHGRIHHFHLEEPTHEDLSKYLLQHRIPKEEREGVPEAQLTEISRDLNIMKHKLGAEASRNWHAVVQYVEESPRKRKPEAKRSSLSWGSGQAFWDSDYKSSADASEQNILQFAFPPERLIPLLRRAICQAGKQPGTILELGSGDGALAVLLQDEFCRAVVTGIDISPELIKHAQNANVSSQPRPHFVCADATKLGSIIPDESIDLVIAKCLEYRSFRVPPEGPERQRVADFRRKILAEAFRVLAPGGRCVIVSEEAAWNERELENERALQVGFKLDWNDDVMMEEGYRTSIKNLNISGNRRSRRKRRKKPACMVCVLFKPTAASSSLEGKGERAANSESAEAAQIQNGSGINGSPSSISTKEVPNEEKTELAAAAPAEVEVKTANKEETKKEESAGISPAERSDLEQLKKDIIERKAQLKAEGMSGTRMNEHHSVVQLVARMNELKEKECPGSVRKDKKPSSISTKEVPNEEKTEPAAAAPAEVEVKTANKEETKKWRVHQMSELSEPCTDRQRPKPLEEMLTVVLVTSPVPSNPSTEMLEWTLRSYVASAGLDRCAKIIVSDGFTVATNGQRERPKSGRIPPEWEAPYDEYRRRLDALVAPAESSDNGCSGPSIFLNSRHLRMEQHKGFGGCTYCSLRLVSTPYVLVLQHDRPCLRDFDATRVVAAMASSKGEVKYVGLPTKASLARVAPDAVMSRCHVRIGAAEGHAAASAAENGIELRVLLFWYDSSHICHVPHYCDFVFAKGRVPGGGFPEDSFGQAMHADICAAAPVGRWREAHAAYGTYLLADGNEPMVGHVRGNKYKDAADLQELGWAGHTKRAGPHAQVFSHGDAGRADCTNTGCKPSPVTCSGEQLLGCA